MTCVLASSSVTLGYSLGLSEPSFPPLHLVEGNLYGTKITFVVKGDLHSQNLAPKSGLSGKSPPGRMRVESRHVLPRGF